VCVKVQCSKQYRVLYINYYIAVLVMQIALYFGSFNPIHMGHLIIAQHVLAFTQCKQLWFVISPHNPLKESASLLPEQHRLHLVRLAIEDNAQFKASDIEFRLPRPSYTIDTLTYVQEKYPQHQFSIVMGGDSYANITRWKNYEQILKHYPIIMYQRPGFSLPNVPPHELILLQAPLLDISATIIRQYIQSNKSIQYLVPNTVQEYIIANKYYH
jgi:nicotinate-nucleotide adenylyltransferase